MPSPPPLDHVEVADLLRRLLEAVERGDVTAPDPMIAHLRGALAAVEALRELESVRDPAGPQG